MWLPLVLLLLSCGLFIKVMFRALFIISKSGRVGLSTFNFGLRLSTVSCTIFVAYCLKRRKLLCYHWRNLFVCMPHIARPSGGELSRLI